MKLFRQALCAFAVVWALGGAGSAQAQLLDLTINSSHGPRSLGDPQPGSIRPAGTPGPPPLIAGTYYSSTTPIDKRNFFFVPGATNLATFLSTRPLLTPLPAQAASSSEFKVRLDTVAGVSSQNFDDLKAFKLNANCFAVGDPNTATIGVHPTLIIHRCDAMDIKLSMNGVGLTVHADEGSPLMRIAIPSIGLDMTSKIIGTPFCCNVDRGYALSQIYEAALNSGQANRLAAQLLGKPDDFVAPRGSLPEGGNLIKGTMTVGDKTRSFGADNPGQIIAYLLFNDNTEFSDFGLPYIQECKRAAGSTLVVGICSPVSATFSFLGIEVQAQSAANSPDGTFTIPDLGVTFTSTNATKRQDAIDQLVRYATDTVDRSKLTAAYARYLAQYSPNDPLVGNPLSAQGQLTRSALDLDTPSTALKEDNGKGGGARPRDTDPAGWMVGGRVGHLEAGDSQAEYVDAVFERGFRFKEGSRMRVKLSMPVSYIDYGSSKGGNGGRTATLGLRSALEVPLQEGKWVVEPSASAAAFYSSNVVSSGALYLFGISSRYKLAPVGRGHIIIGNAITHSSTLHIEAGDFATPKIQNTSLRNGLAYQVPYGRFLGRQGTVRASYTYTRVFGDQVFVDEYHEVSLSYGVASREASARQVGEVLRLGLNGSFGNNFTAIALSAGYHF